MKTLQKRVQVLYRFRCERCRSKFEMTEEEKIENDWKFTDEKFKKLNPKFPSNRLNYFDCPVCERVSFVSRNDMHKYSVMDDETEIQEY